MDLGTKLRGVDMGPSAIRIAGLTEKLTALGLHVYDEGNLTTPHARAAQRDAPSPRGERPLPFGKPIVKVCRDLMTLVETALERQQTPLVLGGDHSVAMGTFGGVARFARKHKKKFGLLWVDAHGDCNTPETSPSGNIHGMPLAVLLGHGARILRAMHGYQPAADPKHTVLIGVRNLDAGERKNIRDLGIHVFTMRDIDERGVSACMREALALVTSGTDGFHLSFDIDSLDPTVAPGVGTPISGGLTIREAHLIMEMVADTRAMIGCELVEVNTALDIRNVTAQLAAELLCSAFGASIL
jgi:arginase